MGRRRCPAAPHSRASLGARVMLPVTLLAIALAPQNAVAVPNHPGKWTASQDWNSPAVHMMLMPGGPSNKHSRVVWWNHGSEVPVGKVLGWDEQPDGPINGGAFPAFTEYTLQGPIPNWFCAGHTFGADGRLIVTGGDERFEVGIRKTGFLDPEADANGEFVAADDMAKRRWYPTNSLLPDSRIVTHSGSSAFSYVTVGGRNGSGAAVATVERVDMTTAAEVWEPTLTPTHPTTSVPMDPVSEASIASTDGKGYLFGGRDASGALVNKVIELVRDRNVNGSDYKFASRLITDGSSPPARTGHTAVAISDEDFVVIGGHNNTLMVPDRVWHAHAENGTVTWTRLDPTPSGTLPTLRGAVAVYDSGRVFVFGGATTLAGPADNGQVYAMQIDASASSYTLTPVTVNGTAPSPRAYATMTLDPLAHQLDAVNPNPSSRYRRALLFGGLLSNGSPTNELHALWIKDAATVYWQALNPTPAPAARAHHAAAADGNSATLVISGGEVTAGVADASVWALDLVCGSSVDCDLGASHWEQRPNLPQALRRHAAVRFGTEPVIPRHPEVFDPRTAPGGNSWTVLANAPRWHEWYPFGFSMPRLPGDIGDRQRVFYAGPDLVSTMLEVGAATGTWTNHGSTTGLPWQFKGGSAVLYRPDKVMKCGSRDTEGGASHGRTASLDLDAVSPAWIRSDNEMVGRNNHNLVLLPGGEVMVIGGGKLFANRGTAADGSQTVNFPQVWDPDVTGSGWVGQWYGGEPNGFRFDSTTVRRNYHTSALLMPDARILVAGGSEEIGTADNMAEVYSPWYLFAPGGGPAVRPLVLAADPFARYGHRFEVRVDIAAASVSRVALVRPASTTHGFDQNQRYVPLTIASTESVSGGTRLCVQAPADSFEAPPGDYLLFVLNTAGTPALARWVRVERFNPRPSRVLDFAYVDGSYPGLDDGLFVDWTPPGDDSLGACRGAATEYQIRWKHGAITSWSDWASGHLVANPPPPGAPGVPPRQFVRITGLTPGAVVSIGLVSRNNASANGNWSALSNILELHLAGGGSGGGGEGEILHLEAGGAGMLAAGEEALVAPDPFQNNTLFPGVPAGELRTDRIPLPNGPHWERERAQVRLGRWGSGSLLVRSARLVAVDHSQGKVLANDASLIMGSIAPARSVTSESGEDIGPTLSAPSGHELRAGTFAHVDLGAPGARALLVRVRDDVRVADGARAGLEVQVPSGSGWVTLATLMPRELPTDQFVALPGNSEVRLVALGGCRLHATGRVEVIEANVGRVQHEPVGLRHSVLGELPASFGTAGVKVGGGESLIVEFTPGEPPAGYQRDWFLEVTGVQTPGVISVGSSEISLREGDTEGPPVQFALHPAQPNPSTASVAFAFDLPEASSVRLDVFDLLGRRVAIVAEADWLAGRHRVSWDGRSSAGTLAPPGVYTIRLAATGFTARRQFVRMP